MEVEMLIQRAVQEIVDLSRKRADGVYKRLGSVYRVRDGRPTHIAHLGKIYAYEGGMLVEVGTYNGSAKPAMARIA